MKINKICKTERLQEGQFLRIVRLKLKFDFIAVARTTVFSAGGFLVLWSRIHASILAYLDNMSFILSCTSDGDDNN